MQGETGRTTHYVGSSHEGRAIRLRETDIRIRSSKNQIGIDQGRRLELSQFARPEHPLQQIGEDPDTGRSP